MAEKIPFDYLGARKAGYSDNEIQGFLKEKYSFDFDIASAKSSGYSDNEIADYITKYEPPVKKKVGFDAFSPYGVDTRKAFAQPEVSEKPFDIQFDEANKRYDYFNKKLVGKVIGTGRGDIITPYKEIKENALKPEGYPELTNFQQGDIVEYPKNDFAPTGYKQLQGDKWVDIVKPAQISKVGQEAVVKSFKPKLSEGDARKMLSEQTKNANVGFKELISHPDSEKLNERLINNPELSKALEEVTEKNPTKARTSSGRFQLFEEAVIKNYKLDKDAFNVYPTVDHAEFQKNISNIGELNNDPELQKYFARKDVSDLLHLLALQESGDQELSSALNYFPNYKKKSLEAEDRAMRREGFISGAGKSTARGALDLIVNSIYGGIKSTPAMIALEKVTGMDKVSDELKDRYDLWAQASLTTGESPSRFSEILNQTLQTAPQMAGLVLTKNPTAANIAFVATPSFGQSYKESLDRGLSEPVAYIKGVADAAIQSLSETVVPDRKLIAGFKPSKELTELGAKEFGSSVFNAAFKKEVRDYLKEKVPQTFKEIGGQYLEEQIADKSDKLKNVVVNALAETDFNTEVNSEEELNLLGSVALLTGGTKALGMMANRPSREALRISDGTDIGRSPQEIISKVENIRDELTKETPATVQKEQSQEVVEAKKEVQPNALTKAVEEGKITGIYADLVKQGKSEDVLKDIAQQAQNIGQDGTKLTDGKDAEIKKATIDQFGEDVVNEAVEKYPSKPVGVPDRSGEEVVKKVTGTKVSDKDGSPIVVYHGSGRKGKNSGFIEQFDESMVSKDEIDFPVNGFFFAGRKGEAEIYGGEKNVGSYYVDIKNPASRADLDAAIEEARTHPDYNKEKGEFHNPTLVRKILIEKGFDGYIPKPFGKPNMDKLMNGESIKFDGKYFRYDREKNEVYEFDQRENENMTSRDALDVMSLDDFKQEYSEKGIFIAFKPDQIHPLKSQQQTPKEQSELPKVKKSVLEKPIEEVSIDDILSELRGDDGEKKGGVSRADLMDEEVNLPNGRKGKVVNIPEVINGFYSPIAKSIAETKFDKLPSKQWVEKFAKGEEAKWTGLTDWLKQQPGNVSKQEILQYLKENRIQVVEVVKGGAEQKDLDGYAYDVYGKDFSELTDSQKKVVEDLFDEGYTEETTKFSQYQLEGQKENYKEVLVTLPNVKEEGAEKRLEKLYKIADRRNLTDAEQEEIVQLERDLDTGGKYAKQEFKSSHFDEPNILVHLRMNTRTDADGNKVLFLEEIQSDWGQKGKREGFGEKPKKSFIIKDRSGQILMESDTREGVEEMIDYYKSRHGAVGIEEREATDWAISGDSKKIPSAPFVTETPSWTKLGLKVALKEAVKQGADKIAWTTGEQQNDRYDLSKQVDEILYSKNNNGTYDITATRNREIMFQEYEIKPERLEDYIGKEVAQKVVNGEGVPPKPNSAEFKTTLRGEDLKVGGKGMKGFYGSPSEGKLGIVGEVAKSLFKQVPKKIEIKGEINRSITDDEIFNNSKKITLDEAEDLIEDKSAGDKWVYVFENGEPFRIRTSGDLAEAKVLRQPIYSVVMRSKTTQHSITITPELRASVQEGLPMFDITGKQIQKGSQEDIAKYIQSAKVVLNKLYPNATLEVYETSAEFEKAGGSRNARGTADMRKDGSHRIMLNLEAIQKTASAKTAVHEVIHPIVYDKYGVDTRELGETWNNLVRTMRDVPGMEKVFDHARRYPSSQQAAEGITELLAQISVGGIDINAVPKAKQNAFIELINKILKALGINTQFKTPEDFSKFAEDVRNAFTSANVEGLKEVVKSRKFDQYLKAAEKLSDLDPEKRKQLEELLKKKIEQDLKSGKITQDQANEFYRKAGIEPPKAEVREGDGDEGGDGITHAQTAVTRTKFGFEEYEKQPETFEQWDKEAAERIANGDMPKLIKKLQDGGMPSEVEQRMMGKYIAELGRKVEENPSDENLNRLHEAIVLSDIVGGRAVGKSLVSRKGTFLPDDSLAAFFEAERMVNKDAPLTEGQKEKVKKEWEELEKAKNEYNAYVFQKESELSAKEAQLKISEESKSSAERKKRTRKTDKEFSEERNQIIDAIREKLRKARGETQVTILPYAKELIAIAPDVAKLVRNLVGNGVTKLADVVDRIHEILKEDIKDISKQDVVDLIAGNYNEKKKTRNQLARDLYELRTEAQLINKLDALQKGDKPTTEKKKIQRNQQIEELRKQIKSITAEDVALDRVKSGLNSQIQKIEGQIKRGDYSKPEKKPQIKLDKEGLALKDKLIKLQQQRDARLLLQQRQNESGREKALRYVAEVFNIPRTLMTIGDFSGLLRQNLFFSLGHPGMTAKALPLMFKSFTSQKIYDRWFADFKETPRYNVIRESRLAIADTLSHDLSKREENFMSTLAEKIPLGVGKVVKGSERSYTMLLNKMRVDMFNYFADQMEARGMTVENSPKQYKAMAEYINNATGRSDFGENLNRIAPILNATFFSPRLIASRVNMLTYWAQPRFWKTLPKEARIDYFRNWASLLAVGGTIMALAALAGADVEDDPRSSDFGKIKSGDTRWDIWGGAQPYIRTFAQVATGKRKSTNSGKIYDLDGDDIFGENRMGVVTDFFRNKLAPVPGAAVDVLSGRTSIGDKIVYEWGSDDDKEISIDQYVKQRLLPMTITGTAEAIQHDGLKSLFTVGVPSTFGVGTQTYSTPPPKEETFKIYQKNGNGVRNATKEEVERYKKDADSSYNQELKKAEQGKGWGYNKYGELTLDDRNIKKKGNYNKLSEEDKKQLLSRLRSSVNQKTKDKFNY